MSPPLPRSAELLPDLLPPVEELQDRLATHRTEGNILRRLLRLALHRRREAQRLAQRAGKPSQKPAPIA